MSPEEEVVDAAQCGLGLESAVDSRLISLVFCRGGELQSVRTVLAEKGDLLGERRSDSTWEAFEIVVISY
jgi:hypothetical protein